MFIDFFKMCHPSEFCQLRQLHGMLSTRQSKRHTTRVCRQSALWVQGQSRGQGSMDKGWKPTWSWYVLTVQVIT